MYDLYFDDYSGYGMGFDNIDLGFGKLLFPYLGDIGMVLTTEIRLSQKPRSRIRAKVAFICTPSTSEFMTSMY